MNIELDDSLIIDFDNLPTDDEVALKYIEFLNEKHYNNHRESFEQYKRIKEEFTYKSDKNIDWVYYDFQKFMWLFGQTGIDIPWTRETVVIYPESRKGEKGTYEGLKTIIPKIEYISYIVYDESKKYMTPSIINGKEIWEIKNNLVCLPPDSKVIFSQHNFPKVDYYGRIQKRLYNTEVEYSEETKEYYLVVLTPYGEMFFNTYIQ
jgi:hypothetical protein